MDHRTPFGGGMVGMFIIVLLAVVAGNYVYHNLLARGAA